MKNSLSLSYLKSTVKTSKINNEAGIIGSFYFIKSVIKCLSLGFEILFVDETSILSETIIIDAGEKKGKKYISI